SIGAGSCTASGLGRSVLSATWTREVTRAAAAAASTSTSSRTSTRPNGRFADMASLRKARRRGVAPRADSSPVRIPPATTNHQQRSDPPAPHNRLFAQIRFRFGVRLTLDGTETDHQGPQPAKGKGMRRFIFATVFACFISSGTAVAVPADSGGGLVVAGV